MDEKKAPLVAVEGYWTADGALILEFADGRPMVRLDWPRDESDVAFPRRVFASETPAPEPPQMDQARYERFREAGL